jgi:hypothetical protein
MPAFVHLSKQSWKLLVIYTLQKENPKASGLFTASGFTIIESAPWQVKGVTGEPPLQVFK